MTQRVEPINETTAAVHAQPRGSIGSGDLVHAQRHHWLPDSGWVTHRLDGEGDIAAALDLFRLAYARAADARRRHDARLPASGDADVT